MRNDTLAKSRMTETESSEISALLNAHWDTTEFESEARMLTQEGVGEQINTYIAPLTKHLEDFTRLTQGMSSVHRKNFSPRASTTANSSESDSSPASNSSRFSNQRVIFCRKQSESGGSQFSLWSMMVEKGGP